MAKKITYQDFKDNQHPEFDFNKKPVLDERQAREQKNIGIDRAVKKADNDSPGWSDRAYKFFVEKFLLIENGPFMAEKFRAYCAAVDFDLPDNARAFGGVIKRAAAAGIIVRVGFQPTKNKKAHLTPATLWRQVKPSERKN